MNTENLTGTRRVWDLPVRVIHWSLLAAVAGAWASREIEGDWFRVHTWCGYAVLVLSATRLVWGFVGTRHARFAAFVRGPAAVFRYARNLFTRQPDSATAGHNPLGGLMVLALLAMLLAQAITGLFANDQIMETGPLFGYVTAALSDRLTTFHKQLFDLLLAAVALHVVAALAYLFLKHDNLILPMITGRKPAARVPATDEIPGSRTWLAVVIALVLGGILYAIVRNAPEASLFVF
jgi:cytochrome b